MFFNNNKMAGQKHIGDKLSTQKGARSLLKVGGGRCAADAKKMLALFADKNGSDSAERVASIARDIAHAQGRKTVLARDMQVAVRAKC